MPVQVKFCIRLKNMVHLRVVGNWTLQFWLAFVVGIWGKACYQVGVTKTPRLVEIRIQFRGRCEASSCVHFPLSPAREMESNHQFVRSACGQCERALI